MASTQPVAGTHASDATTLACEAKCGAMADCAGFTRKGAEKDCYFYSEAQASGVFSHLRPDVSWRPKALAEGAHTYITGDMQRH